jgi:hypothetical protein
MERAPQYPLDKSLDGPQSQSGCCGEEKNGLLKYILVIDNGYE